MNAKVLWFSVVAVGIAVPAAGAERGGILAERAGWELTVTPDQCRWYAERVLRVDADLGASAAPDRGDTGPPAPRSGLLANWAAPAAPSGLPAPGAEDGIQNGIGAAVSGATTASRPLPAGGRTGPRLVGFAIPAAAGILAAAGLILAASRREA